MLKFKMMILNICSVVPSLPMIKELSLYVGEGKGHSLEMDLIYSTINPWTYLK